MINYKPTTQLVQALMMLLGFALTTAPAEASFHLWQVSEIYSNADGSVQFIEYSNCCGGEQFLNSLNVELTRTGGSSFVFPSDLPVPGVQPSTANTRFLVATPGYAAAPGAVAPDYTLPSGNFFDINGDTLRLDGDAFGICCSAAFGPGELPIDGSSSLNFPGGTVLFNSPTNFAGQTGFVPEPMTLATMALGLALCAGRRAPRTASANVFSAEASRRHD